MIKKKLLLTILGLLCVSGLRAQAPITIPSATVQFSGNPTGPCQPQQSAVNLATGILFGCGPGLTWSPNTQVTPLAYGAKGDVVTLGVAATDTLSRVGTFVTSTCTISSASAVLTCTNANFLSTDVGKSIVVNFAGATSPAPCTAAYPCALVTTILSWQSATQVTLSANATTAVATNGLVYYGTDDRAALASCIQLGTLQGGRCTINNGYAFMVSPAAGNATINFYALNNTPQPNGIIDGAGDILFAPQGTLTSPTNDRLFQIISNSPGQYQVAGQAKYTLAASATGATQSGSTFTFTNVSGNFGADIVAGRCVAVSGVGVAAYNSDYWKVLGGGSGTTAFTVTSPPGLSSIAASGGGTVSVSVCPGDTTVTLQNSGDAANFSVGEWFVFREHDNVAGDVIYSDWAQVASIAGAVITMVNPMRQSMPNSRTYTTSGGTCSVGNPCGLTLIPVPSQNLMQGYQIKEFAIIVPKIVSTNFAAGIAVTLARGVVVTGHICTNAAQNCVFNYLTQGCTISNNTFNTQIPNEQASDVDYVVTGNHINQPGMSLFGLIQAPTNSGWDLDFGSSFGSFTNNTFGTCFNGCISSFTGPYYSTISGNTFGRMTGAGAAISISGGRYNQIFGNILPGGPAGTNGISVLDDTSASTKIYSDSNVIFNNSVTGYGGLNYACTGTWVTDTCSDPTHQAGIGVNIGGQNPSGTPAMLSITVNSTTKAAMNMQDISSGGLRHIYSFGPGVLAGSTFSLYDAGSGFTVFQCYENLSNWCKFGHGFGTTETTAPSLLGAGNDQCYGDSTAHALECSYNNGSYLKIPQTVVSGTTTLTAATVTTATCQTVNTTAATGALTTDVLEWNYTTNPTGTTDARMTIAPSITAGNVNFTRCNPTAASIIATAIVIQWHVKR